MKSWRFENWCQEAVAQIQYRPDREMVYRELQGHMEERYEACLERGMSEEEAEAWALSAMGSAAEIAPQLAEIHRPFWGYLLSASRYVLIVLACIMIVPLFRYVEWLDIRKPEYLYDFTGEHDPYLDEEYNGGQRVLYVEPRCEDKSDGYTFRVTKAAVWERNSLDTLHFQMDVVDPGVWTEDGDMGRWFWAEDSKGNRYVSFYESGACDRYVSGNSYRTGLFTRTYEMWLVGYENADVEWVTLHYDRAGRDIVLHMDLTGGEANE
ncbi:MAG: hypothetical protein J6I64_06210 [Lachnospiraceae bacterium]|nr:hypothetical protein [Lachnospiraceae bacterium]